MLAALALPMLLAVNDPYAIYRGAMQHLATLPQPKYIIETEHRLAVSTAGAQSAPQEWDERLVFNSETRRECVLSIPFKPEPPEIGESYFAPDSWLIRHQTGAPSAIDNAHLLKPDLSDFRTIASVISMAKPSYEIRLAGIDALTHGGSAYHLTLRPLSKPLVHNLRQLWIDTRTGAIMRAVIEGYYRPTYNLIPDDTYVTEDFGKVGPYWLVIHHVWTYHDPMSSTTYQFNATSLTMQFPQSLPDWFFDPKLFPRHFGDVPGILGS